MPGNTLQSQAKDRMLKALEMGLDRMTSYKLSGLQHNDSVMDDEFKARMDAAEAAAQNVAIIAILKAINSGDWKAAAWFLERRNPKEWGRRDNFVIEGNGQKISFSFNLKDEDADGSSS